MAVTAQSQHGGERQSELSREEKVVSTQVSSDFLWDPDAKRIIMKAHERRTT